jgi:YD repeat-containing protein
MKMKSMDTVNKGDLIRIKNTDGYRLTANVINTSDPRGIQVVNPVNNWAYTYTAAGRVVDSAGDIVATLCGIEWVMAI